MLASEAGESGGDGTRKARQHGVVHAIGVDRAHLNWVSRRGSGR